MESINNQQFSDWAQRIRKSDEAAFKELFDATYEHYVRYAWRFTRNKETAMDIVQEGFIKIWNYRRKLDPSQSMKTYIYRMIKHKALNHLRDHQQDRVPLNSLHLAEVQAVETDVEVELEQEQSPLASALTQWIGQLPERQREAFKLSRFEGLTHEEIADIMDVSPRTVNNHIVTALKNLEDQYDKFKDGKKKSI